MGVCRSPGNNAVPKKENLEEQRELPAQQHNWPDQKSLLTDPHLGSVPLGNLTLQGFCCRQELAATLGNY